MMNLDKKNDNSLNLWDSFTSLWNDAFSKEMKTDIEETDKEYILSVELPGMKKENVSVTFNDDELTIRVKKEEKTKEDKDKSYICKERTSIDMTRSYYLENADENNITAKMENGILTLNVGKQKDISNPKKVINIE